MTSKRQGQNYVESSSWEYEEVKLDSGVTWKISMPRYKHEWKCYAGIYYPKKGWKPWYFKRRLHFNWINAKTNVNYRRIIREVKLREIYVQIY